MWKLIRVYGLGAISHWQLGHGEGHGEGSTLKDVFDSMVSSNGKFLSAIAWGRAHNLIE
jgi:hypothetical protein